MTAPHGHISYWQLYRSFLRFLAKKRNVGGGGEVHPICVLLPKIPNAWVEVWPKDTSLHLYISCQKVSKSTFINWAT